MGTSEKKENIFRCSFIAFHFSVNSNSPTLHYLAAPSLKDPKTPSHTIISEEEYYSVNK